MSRLVDYLYILATIFFTVYGQLILKWRLAKFSPFPTDTVEKFKFFISVLIDPIVFSGFLSAFLASLAWMVVMTKFELSFAYPFMSLNFAVVLFFSVILLNEPLTINKVIGVIVIIIGTIISSGSYLGSKT